MDNEMRLPKYPISVQLSGFDGNAFSIMGRVTKAMRRAGCTQAEIDEYIDASKAGDYDNLLRVAMDTVHVF